MGNLRLKAASLHLLVSACVAALCWWLVFRLWHPPPFSALTGASNLFLLLVGVDVVMGPALTAIVANPAKTRGELTRDIGVVGVLQLLALAYGLYSAALARPVFVAYEFDVFRLVSAADVDEETLSRASLELRRLSWSGPRLVAIKKPSQESEMQKLMDLELAGVHIAYLPEYWASYALYSDRAWNAALPLAYLVESRPELNEAAFRMIKEHRLRAGDVRVMPLIAKGTEGVVLLSHNGTEVVGYLQAPKASLR